MSDEQQRPKAKGKKKRSRCPIPPPPPFTIQQARDLPRLSLLDVAGFMRISLPAVKKHLDGRPSGKPDPVGEVLRGMLCPRPETPKNAPRFIQGRPFAEWIMSQSRPQD